MECVCVCLSGSLTLVLRNFAKNLEGWLDTSMANVAPEMVQAKVKIADHRLCFILCVLSKILFHCVVVGLMKSRVAYFVIGYEN